MSWNPDRLPDLRGRVYAVTGATGGIGYFAAEQLAAAGAEVVLVSRSAAKLEVAAAAIRGQAPNAVTRPVRLDLTSLASVAEAGEQLAALPRLDGIFLNGGPMEFSTRAATRDGLPLMLGAHTVANVALVARLLRDADRLAADRPLRIVHTSTGFVQRFGADPREARRTPRTGVGAYTKAKALTEVYAFELDRRLRAAGVRAASIVTRPGVGVDARSATDRAGPRAAPPPAARGVRVRRGRRRTRRPPTTAAAGWRAARRPPRPPRAAARGPRCPARSRCSSRGGRRPRAP